MELTIDNLEKIKRLSEKYAGFWRLEFTFFDLIDLFGSKIWDWRDLFPEDIIVVDKNFNMYVAEKQLILNALEQTQFSQKKAARLLGITPRRLNYRISQLKITHHSWSKNKEVKHGN